MPYHINVDRHCSLELASSYTTCDTCVACFQEKSKLEKFILSTERTVVAKVINEPISMFISISHQSLVIFCGIPQLWLRRICLGIGRKLMI